MIKVLPNNISPVAVGALGGSGTRVVADILMQAGIYMGENLNNANDNLIFTCLFKRPEWYKRSSLQDRLDLIRLFEKMMKKEALTLEERLLYAKAYVSNWNYTFKNKIKAPFRRKERAEYIGWGWKEPNTHLFIKELDSYFPDLRYIHVIRNGLDMAYSSNVQQLKNWGAYFDVEVPEDERLLAMAQLNYWIKANDAAINIGKERLDNRFYLLNFEELCLNPQLSVKALMDFLKLEISSVDLEKMCGLPRLPSSTDRYLKEDISNFSVEQLQSVERLGYPIKQQPVKI